MSPRKPKPPAIPIEIPRTERDFDTLTSAIEAHMKQGERIGKALNAGKIDHKEALNQAGDADEKLYNINDAILMQRARDRDEEIAKEKQE